jgi:hypothetical protein
MTNIWNDPACTSAEALTRARKIIGHGGQYILGTGDYLGSHSLANVPSGLSESPWTEATAGVGSDCAGFICWAFKKKRHRPGFNKGAWSTVEDDINCNSLLEDSVHLQQLCTRVNPGESIKVGDCLAWPTFRLRAFAEPHEVLTFVGHIGMVDYVPSDFVFSTTNPTLWHRLGIIQCHGPNHFTPGVVETDGSIWGRHDELWGKEEHRTHVIRFKEIL